jgi:hypothetical protein
VSGYELDDRAIEVRSSGEAKDFYSNLCENAGSGFQPRLLYNEYWESFPRE